MLASDPLVSHVVPQMDRVVDDEQEILRFALDAPAKAALVTLVEIRGGASRALGSQMAVREDGSYCGYVSGGCTEAAVAAEALESMRLGSDRFLQLGEGSPFFDIVLPCGGGLTLSIHLLKDRSTLAALLAQLKRREPASLSYAPAQQSLRLDAVVETGWTDDTFHRAFQPRRRIALAGAGIEAEATRRVALAAGYDVVPVVPGHLDPETAVVILLHDLDRELPILETSLAGRSRYIGALGSARTHQRRCDALRQRGYDEAALARIKGPIGLFGPARDGTSLALSILADIAR